jgi:L-asparaginase
MARVAIVFTGGTISMKRDPVAGGNVPLLDGEALLAGVPGLAGIAELEIVDLGRTPASHFSFPALFGIAARITALAADPRVDGIVVVQGTDTLDETAFLFDLVHASPTPVVVTGAMRAADEAGADGPANLRDAVRAAADPALSGEGVLVTLAGELHAADEVVKGHATSVAAFRTPNLGPLGRVESDGVRLGRRRLARRRVVAERAAEPVFLVTAGVATDGALVEATRPLEPAGYVIEATGSGNTDPRLLDACRAAIADGIPVALASRTGAGAVGGAYAFPGGGAHWLAAGALPCGTLAGPKARVALAVGIGAGLRGAALAAFMEGREPA